MTDEERNRQPRTGAIYRSTIDNLTLGKVTKIEGDMVTVRLFGDRYDVCTRAEFSDSWTWRAN